MGWSRPVDPLELDQHQLIEVGDAGQMVSMAK